jgi:hypothetical protein
MELISRAEFVLESSRIDAILFQNDAMLFVGKAKKDQEGTCNIDHHPWHLYGNTKHPYICCFLAIGWHLISNPTILVGRRAIF